MWPAVWAFLSTCLKCDDIGEDWTSYYVSRALTPVCVDQAIFEYNVSYVPQVALSFILMQFHVLRQYEFVYVYLSVSFKTESIYMSKVVFIMCISVCVFQHE